MSWVVNNSSRTEKSRRGRADQWPDTNVFKGAGRVRRAAAEAIKGPSNTMNIGKCHGVVVSCLVS